MSTKPQSLDDEAPLTNFSNCHAGIVSHLTAFGELPALLEPAARARRIAEDTLHFFREAVYEHHADEEKELFPAVLASAIPGEERDQLRHMVDRLTAEHREIEQLWTHIEPQLKKFAKGQPADVDGAAIARLVRQYSAHAGFEEAQFLPLCEKVLGRNSNHMAALGLSLHMRHVPMPIAHI